MRKLFRKWWEGEYVLYKNDPNSAVVFINAGHFKRAWTADLARLLVAFYMREWKWVIGAASTVIGALFFKKF